MASTTPPMPPSPPPAPPQYAAAPPPGPPQKKGTSVWLWLLLGCGAILLIIFLVLAVGGYFVAKKVKGFAEDANRNPAMAAAKLMVAASPELEVVSEDKDKGTLTIRNKKTGEEITMDAADIKNGRLKFRNEKGEEVTMEGHGEGESGSFKVRSKEGEMTFGAGGDERIPAWVPRYPGSSPQMAYSGISKGETGGTYSFTTADSVASVIEHYRSALEGAGFEIVTETKTPNGALIHAQKDDQKRSVQVAAGTQDGQTTVSVTFMDREHD